MQEMQPTAWPQLQMLHHAAAGLLADMLHLTSSIASVHVVQIAYSIMQLLTRLQIRMLH
jgi:hypothetical protein